MSLLPEPTRMTKSSSGLQTTAEATAGQHISIMATLTVVHLLTRGMKKTIRKASSNSAVYARMEITTAITVWMCGKYAKDTIREKDTTSIGTITYHIFIMYILKMKAARSRMTIYILSDSLTMLWVMRTRMDILIPI